MKILLNFIISFLLLPPFLFAQWTEQLYKWQTQFSSVYMVDENNGITVGYKMDQSNGVIYRTIDGGQNWVNIPGQGNKLYSVWFSSNTIGFASGASGTIVKTTDGGNFWFSLNSESNRSLYAIRFTNANTGLVAGGHNTNGAIILKTTNQGTNWTEKPCFEIGVLRDLFFVNDQAGWAVGSQQIGDPPNLSDRPIIVKTTDGGESWNSINCGINDCQLRTVCFINENIGWAAGTKNFNDYPDEPIVVIVKTTNGGSTWNSLINNKPGSISELRMCDNNNGWAVGIGDVWGNQYGLNYETTDGGNNWIHRTNLNDIKMGSLFFLNANNGWGTAAYRLYKYQTASDIESEVNNHFNYTLFQNYPNPFNPSTTIEYSIPEESNVAIKIFDLLGNEIDELINERKIAGSYKITFNTDDNLASGMYFYQLITENFSATKKFILLK